MSREIKGLLRAFALLVVLAACSSDNAQQLIAKAEQALDKGDLKTASIQVRSALQLSPDLPKARFLFGKVLLESGDLAAAEIEIRKAQELKHPVDEAVPLLARVLLSRQQYRKVIADYAKYSLKDPNSQADLSASVADAYVHTGRAQDAAALVDATVARSPDSAPIRLVQARLLAGKGDVDGALKTLEQVTRRNPKEIEAWRLQGDLLQHAKHDRQKARVAYQKVLELRHDDVAAHGQLIAGYLADRDLTAAKRQFDVMAKLLPAHPQTLFMAANFALESGDFSRARDIANQLLKSSPDNPYLLVLAATCELNLNSLVQAEGYLSKAISLSPNMPTAKRLLARVYLRRGEPGKALAVLAPLIAGATVDAEALEAAAEAHMLSGDPKAAEAFFARVTQLKPEDPRTRTALALSKMAQGNVEQAMTDLQTIAASDKGTVADLALVNVRLYRQDVEGAFKAIDDLERKSPDKPLAPDLRGRAFLLKRDAVNARASFEKALAKDPVYFPAVAALAQMDYAENKSAAAQARFEALLKADPRNTRALVSLAGLRARLGGNADEVANLIARAIEVNPSEPSTRLLLVDHWLNRGNADKALSAAQAALAASPNETALLDALGRAQLAKGEVGQALSTFGKLATQRPDSAVVQVQLAEAQLLAKNQTAAEQAWRRALDLDPGMVAAQRGLISQSVRAKQPEVALQAARNLQRQRPKEAVGHILEGDTYAAFKDFDAAARAYRAGMPKQGGMAAVIRIYEVLKAGKGKDEAGRFAEEWSRQNPKEASLLRHRAGEALIGGDFALAEQRFSELLTLVPSDAETANNLAWLLAKNKKPGALAMAERALVLSPNNPSILDTLAYALGESGQLERALETSKSALQFAPDNSAIRLNFAKLLLKADDKKRARVELEELAKLGAKFAGHKEVSELLKGT